MTMTKGLRATLLSEGKIRSMWLALAGLAVLALAGGLLPASQSLDPLAGIPICRPNAIDASAAASPGGRYADRDFMAENEIAMTRMMTAMTISPTGDADRDFVAMMVAHHQGAIDMAIAALRHGCNEQLQRIAQEIVVTQGQEILAMRSATLAAYSPPGRKGPRAASGQAAAAVDSKGLPIPGATEGVR
jgi:hypothetical protein